MAETAKTAKSESKGFDFGKCAKDTFDTIKAVFVKPTSEGAKAIDINDQKEGWIKNGIFLVVITLVGLINTALSLIFVKTTSFNYSNGKIGTDSKLDVKFDNLSSINWFETIGKGILTTAVFAIIIAGAAYLVATLMKKKANIVKLTGSVLLGLLPITICGVAATIISLFWGEGALFITLASMVYGLAIMISLISKESGLSGDKLIYFHLATIVVVALIYYFIILKNESIAKILDLGPVSKLISLTSMF